MQSITTTRSLILGSVLAGALTLGAVQMAAGDSGSPNERTNATSPRSARVATDVDQPTTKTVRERGIVLQGSGTWRGQLVEIFVYENRFYGNSLQIVIGDRAGEPAIGGGEGRDAYVIDGVLNVGLEVDGDLAVVKGSVTPKGVPQRVTEPTPDGELVASRGKHTPLSVKATFQYRGETVDLKFAKAFEYALKSKRSAN